jgi:predicted O-methyltransferase YrrM
MNQIIEQVFQTYSVVGQSGKVLKADCGVDREEGEFLYSLIREDPGILRTLEVGCAQGFSSLFICSALAGRSGANHTIIDPSQTSYWDRAGVSNLERAGFNFFQLIERGSEFVLPRLLSDAEGQYDFVFVDGFHTFDHTLIDCFYATRLLRVGGVLAIDDVTYASVRRVVNFVSSYPCYRIQGVVGPTAANLWIRLVFRTLMAPISRETWSRFISARLCNQVYADRKVRMVALKKVGEDLRDDNWHNDAF